MAWWHWILVHLSQETGTSNSASRAYDFFSGFGSDLGEVSLFGGLFLAYRHLECHDVKCHRLGLHHVDGTPFKACKKHHPTGGNTVAQIHAAHRKAKVK